MTDATTPAGEEPPVRVQLDDLFAPWNRTDAPGVAVGVVKDGSVIYRRGFGMASLETASAITPTTKIRIGSTTKHFTALLALLLAEEGKLDLDVPIRTYVPELSGPGGDPSIRLLLQHRGGSRCYLDLGFIGHAMAVPASGRALAMQARQQGRNFPVGEAMTYNNGGYHLISHAIERAGGAPFEEQLKRRLFDPVGMADTALIKSDYAIVAGMATNHVLGAGGGWRRGIFPSKENLGEGAIVSTVDDMIRWMAHLRARDRFGSERTWQALTELPRFPDGTTGAYALGLMLGKYRGARTVHHAGGVIGASCQMIQFPDHGLDIVVLANGALEANPVLLAERVADIVLSAALTPAKIPTEAAPYAELLGHWWSDETGMIYELRDDAGALKLALCGNPAAVAVDILPDGQGRCSMLSIADITLDLEGSRKSGTLAVRFGGTAIDHRSVGRGAVNPTAFGGAAAGRYYSHDADCTASLDAGGDVLRLSLSDPYGTWTSKLTLLHETVAVASTDVGGHPFTFALTFDKAGDQVTGFRASTGRTRNLVFERQ